MKKIIINMTVTMFILVIIMTACTSGAKGVLVFNANGEDFVRQGFIDKDGWQINFDNLYVCLSEITAYNEKDGLKACLKGQHWIDLAAGDADAAPIKVGKLDVKPGNYQSLSFKLCRKNEGENKGNSIVMKGTAAKDGKTVPFVIKLDQEIGFDGKDGYVGDELKGYVETDKPADTEMTFHFDHIFGDIEAGDDSHINTGSVGFNFFYKYLQNDNDTVSQSDLVNEPEYNKLLGSLNTLGHLGEGHCEAFPVKD